MIFNIYYINFPKVYEIKMMLGNIILLNKELEKTKGIEGEAELRSKIDFGTKFFKLFNVEGEGKGRIEGSSASKVLETFEVKTTKSVILNDVIENSTTITNFDNVKEGELVKINNVSLSLENEPELRLVKLFTSDAFKGMTVPGANGFDMNNVFNSMFKDYAYKLKGEVSGLNDQILVKIPLTFESEFESSYSVDDLFIGRVSLVGLYKGKIKLGELKNSLEFFQEIGNIQQTINKDEDDEIQNSQYEDDVATNTFNPFVSSLKDDREYHYIDILSIVQIINTPKKND
ncbi:hypothetical protein [Elizabethkingia anophelis]|uniref:hypothetical protein n=1 Tax=Elizabethkingia anophelis TaxID=1117645 RepID=UPI002011D51D|nr:hypothetical protein [Elizabethkingia anophelis]MCL1640989.1 hypothetical protein [Elizabethkingia anophelis]MCL1646790.1 hypothetical protein [Elizabethkingia anophelis]WBS71397.1 hypothetical protein PF435_00770 [Elizabethkingia anophelis]